MLKYVYYAIILCGITIIIIKEKIEMKRFLKKANRGLLLGGLVLFLLVIYIYVDYSTFDEEKPKVKEAVENYIDSFYKNLSENDYEGLYKVVNDYWGDEPVMSHSYYDNKESLSQFFEEHKSKNHDEKYGDVSYKMDKVTISKIGPGMSKAEFLYTAEMELGADGEYVGPFVTYRFGNYSDIKDEGRYIYKVIYEVTVYLKRSDDGWQLSQCEAWEQDCSRYPKEEK